MDVVSPKQHRDGWLLATTQLSAANKSRDANNSRYRYVSKTEMTTVATAKAMIAYSTDNSSENKDDDSNGDDVRIKKGRIEKE